MKGGFIAANWNYDHISEGVLHRNLADSPLLLSLVLLITLLGQLAGSKEGWRPFDSFYWSFVTATTIGYGDIRPTKPGPRIIAIIIGLIGLTLTGILVALAVHAGTVALAAHEAAEKVKGLPGLR